MKKTNTSRRDFLTKCALFGATGASGLYSSLGSLMLPAMAATQPSEYRAMVMIFLSGGNDTNMLVPYAPAAYDEYKQVRRNLALPREELLPISSAGSSGVNDFALHPNMSAAQSLYNDGNLALLANIGALKQPTDRDSYNLRENLPAKLFSHVSQQDFIRSGLDSISSDASGWAGRVADIFNDTRSSRAPICLNVGGGSRWQRGAQTIPYAIPGGSVAGEINFLPGSAERATLDVLHQEQAYEHVFLKEYSRIVSDSLDLSAFMRDAAQVQATQDLPSFGGGRLEQQLKAVASLINARQGLGMQQQVFYVNFLGFDNHGDLLTPHGNRMGELSDALGVFYQALKKMGVENQVTTFTNSDFGRTMSSNGSGSDHGWGGHQLVMGGAVQGGQIYGNHPGFTEDDPQYLGSRGVFIPSTSHDQMSSTIAKWFGGFNDSELQNLFPNLKASYSIGDLDLGFMV